MFGHVKFGVSDYEKSKTVFLGPIKDPPDYGVEMSTGDVNREKRH